MPEAAAIPSPETKKPSFKDRVQATWGPYSALFPYVLPYKGRFIAGLLCGAGFGIISGLLGWVIKHVTSQVLPNGQHAPGMKEMLQGHGAHAAAGGAGMDTIIWTCSLIPAVMILRSVLAYLNAYCMAWVSLRILHNLRNQLFARVVNQSIDFFNKAQTGKLIARVVNDAKVAQGALTQVSCDVVTQPITIITAIVGLLFLDWQFTLVSFILFPVCLVPIIVFGRKVRRTGASEEEGVGAIMTVIHEAFTGIRVVKALGREPYEIRDFEEATKEQFRRAIRVRKAMEIVGPLIEAISAVGVGLALFYVWMRGISAATFIGLLGGLFILYDPVKKLSKIHVNIQKALSATERIFDLMHLEPTVQDAPDAIELASARGEIEIRDLTFRYRTNRPPAVSGINLHIEPGKSYALVGASGSGKSTMLALLLRFYDPQEGSILIDGHDIRSLTQHSLRRQIAIVSQDTFLFNTSILENIRYGRLDATDEEVYEAARQAYAHDFICEQSLGYATAVGDKGCNLSGGQQQRIAIARALLRNAPILLLDEATSALDSESEQQIQSALDRLSAGRTVIAIAHRLSTILKSDQIVAMKGGHIVETGSHAELFARQGHYRHLYDLQFQSQPPAPVASAALVP